MSRILREAYDRQVKWMWETGAGVFWKLRYVGVSQIGLASIACDGDGVG